MKESLLVSKKKIHYIYSFPTAKEVTRIDKNGIEITKVVSYTLQFTDRARFMASSLSNIVNSLAEVIHKIKGKNEHDANLIPKCVESNAKM